MAQEKTANKRGAESTEHSYFDELRSAMVAGSSLGGYGTKFLRGRTLPRILIKDYKVERVISSFRKILHFYKIYNGKDLDLNAEAMLFDGGRTFLDFAIVMGCTSDF